MPKKNVTNKKVAKPERKPHVNETSTGGYMPRTRIPGESYKGASGKDKK